jgi:hypothetical protein
MDKQPFIARATMVPPFSDPGRGGQQLIGIDAKRGLA